MILVLVTYMPLLMLVHPNHMCCFHYFSHRETLTLCKLLHVSGNGSENLSRVGTHIYIFFFMGFFL